MDGSDVGADILHAYDPKMIVSAKMVMESLWGEKDLQITKQVKLDNETRRVWGVESPQARSFGCESHEGWADIPKAKGKLKG